MLVFKTDLSFLRMMMNCAEIIISGGRCLVPNTTLRGTGMDSLYIISILDLDVMEVFNNAFIHGILIIPNPILTMTEQEQVDKYSALINPIKCLK